MPDKPETEETRVEELPPDELGPVPVTIVETEPRWYGMTPQSAVLAVGLAAAGVGIALLVLGPKIAGVVLLGVGVIVLVALVRGPIADALSGPREVARTALVTRVAAGRQLARLRLELDRLTRERDERLRELGEAFYRGDEGATSELRGQVEELDHRAGETREELEGTVVEARERIRSARVQVARTEVVSLDGLSGDDRPE